MNPASTPEVIYPPPHRCPKCALGYVIPTSKDGRFFDYKECAINLPMSVYIPTCGECGTEFASSPGVQEEIRLALAAEYKRHEGMIAKSLERLRRRKGTN